MTNSNFKFRSCSLDLTESCNLNCDYCFTYSKHKRKVLPLDLGKRILDWWFTQVDKEGDVAREVTWWGGEPLLEWELLKELKYYSEEAAKKCDIENVIWGGTTNGILYTPDKVEWCKENNSLFLLSIDGVQPSHDAHRKFPNGMGSWKIVDRNLREAIKIAPYQRVRMSVAPDMLDHFYESILYFFEDIGVENVAYSLVYEANWDEEAFDKFEEQLELIINYLFKKAREDDQRVVKHINEEARIAGQKKLERYNPCGAGGHYAGWSIDGFLFPCHRFNKHGLTTKERAKSSVTIARPKGDSFEYVNHKWREQFYTFKDNIPEDCQECDIYGRSACEGGCYAVNFDVAGGIKKHTESICRVAKIQQKYGIKYREMCDKESINVAPDGWSDDSGPPQAKSCICYNMCYAEGTSREIIHIDRRNDMSCVCYYANYNMPNSKHTRTVVELDEQRKAEQRIIKAAKKLLSDIKIEEETNGDV
jgi:uncharacterized protein